MSRMLFRCPSLISIFLLVLLVLLQKKNGFFLSSESLIFGGYKVGSLYTYNYSFLVSLNDNVQMVDGPKNKPICFQVFSRLLISPVWKKDQKFLILFKLDELTLYNLNKTERSTKAQEFNRFLSFQFYAEFDGHDLLNLYVETANENKKLISQSIASLFQFRLSGYDWEGWETDISGRCLVRYTSNLAGGIKKQKSNCETEFQIDSNLDVKHASHQEKLSNSIYWNHSYEANYTLSNGIVDSVFAIELFQSNFGPHLKFGGKISSSQKLQIDHKGIDSLSNEEFLLVSNTSSVEEAIDLLNSKPEKQNIRKITSFSQNLSQSDKSKKLKNFQNSVTIYKLNLKPSSLASLEITKIFLKLVYICQSTTFDDIFTTIADKRNKAIRLQLMDILGACGTKFAHEAVKKFAFVSSSAESTKMIERYLWALSQSFETTEFIAKDLLTMLDDRKQLAKFDSKVQETILLTVARLSDKKSDQKLSKLIREAVCKSLKKFCDFGARTLNEEECKLIYFRVLQNLRHSEGVQRLLSFLHNENESSVVVIGALKSIAAFHPFQELPSNLKLNIENTLLTFFMDTSTDSTVRLLSAEILLREFHSKTSLVKLIAQLNILQKRSNSISTVDNEFNCFLVNKFIEAAPSSPIIRELISSGVLNWNNLSPSGFSTSFGNRIFSTDVTEGKFSFSMEMKGPVFKRSSLVFDINKIAQSNIKPYSNEQLIQLDVFAGGLSSFVSDEDPHDDAEANARMEMRILGNQLRPFVFFNSMSDLMNLYWAGTASQKSSALQATYFVSKNQRQFRLATGLTADFDVQAVASFDFSGKVDISIWSKISDSLIENSLSFFLRSNFALDFFSFTQLKIKQTAESVAKLKLESSLDFSDSNNIKLCNNMNLPAMKILTCSKRIVKVGSIDKYVFTRNSSLLIPATTLHLNDKNDDLCNKMATSA